MKKILLTIAAIAVLCVGMVYLSLSSTEKVFTTCEIIGMDDLSSIDFKNHDSVLVAASTLYEGGSIKKLMQGTQYRDAWATPIKVPIVFLDTLLGGMKVVEEGGGKQTQSLEIEASNGEIYSLRSINKNPKALIPEFAYTLGLENIVVDGISAQHPYAALVVARLANSANIMHTDPKVVFIPKQQVLDSFNTAYGNRLFMLEHETEDGTNWTPFTNVIDIIDTDNLQELRAKHGTKVTIDEKALVRARLFDLLIGDWDRHAKQWGWIVQQNGEAFKAIPLPGDRDNAFFAIEGILPTLIANKKMLPNLQAFDEDIDYLPGLVMPFDVYFLKYTPERIFIEEAHALQKLMTDAVIEQAFTIWPEEIKKLDAHQIALKIRTRRNALVDYARRFKAILEEKSVLSEPLKGSENKVWSKELLACFTCDE